MANVADISKKTGYSISTVASILRGAVNFKEKTREIVLKTADELSYQPNWLSKALAGSKSMTIGVFGSHFDSFTCIRKIQYIEKVVRKAGYLTYVVGSSIEDVEVQKSYLNNLLARKIDGLIVNCGPTPPNEQIYEMLKGLDIPVVLMDISPHNGMSCVIVNREAGITQAVEHLRGLGHRRIALIANETQFKPEDLRVATYKRAAKAHGIDLLPLQYRVYNEKLPIQDWTDNERLPLRDSVYDIGTIIQDSISNERLPNEESAAYYAVTKKLKEIRIRDIADFPTALVTLGDGVAMAVLKALTNAGFSVPKDVSVVGFGDLNMTSMCVPSLTTVYMHRSPVGSAAAEMLLQLIDKPEEAIEPVVFDSRLVIRETTGPPIN